MHDLENLDLNRLLALHWLLEDLQVTRAARHLGTSQPALSRTLKELRDWFGDPLLIRRGREMVRSSFAESLRPRLAAAIGELRELARPPGSFDAANVTGSFRIGCTDYVATMVLRAWYAHVRSLAPGLDLEIHALQPDSAEALESGALDLLIRPARHRPGSTALARETWVEDRYATFVRADHPLAGRRIGWKRFAELEHVQVGVGRAPSSEIDRIFRAEGYSRRIALRVETFQLGALALLLGDSVATLPAQVGQAIGASLAEIKTPLDLDPFTLDLVWHPRLTARDLHAFVRRSLLEWSVA